MSVSERHKPQLAQQAPAVSIPLVMEPRSGLYRSPVVVMDFQSLYPSVMIAYNLCLSTCLGSVDRKSGVGVGVGLRRSAAWCAARGSTGSTRRA